MSGQLRGCGLRSWLPSLGRVPWAPSGGCAQHGPAEGLRAARGRGRPHLSTDLTGAASGECQQQVELWTPRTGFCESSSLRFSGMNAGEGRGQATRQCAISPSRQQGEPSCSPRPRQHLVPLLVFISATLAGVVAQPAVVWLAFPSWLAMLDVFGWVFFPSVYLFGEIFTHILGPFPNRVSTLN